MKILSWLPILILAASTIIAASAQANDSAFGGSGADLIPLKENRVRMLSEDIVLKFVNDSWDIRADYVFVNESDQAAQIQVGFPEIDCEPEMGDCMPGGFRELRTTVNGTLVKLRTGKVKLSHDWAQSVGKVWLFDVTFPPNAETQIKHTYTVSSGFDASLHHFTAYVTRTGATWRGTIGRARFRVILPADTHTVGEGWGQPRLTDPGGKHPRVELLLEKKDWEPTGDLWISFQSAPLEFAGLGTKALERSGLKPEDQCKHLTQPQTEREKQMCKNLVYALAGYPFKKDSLRKYYYDEELAWKRRKIPEHLGEGSEWTRGLIELPKRDLKDIAPINRSILNYLDRYNTEEELENKKKPEPKPSVKTSTNAKKPRPHGPFPTPKKRGCSYFAPKTKEGQWWYLLVAILGTLGFYRRTHRKGTVLLMPAKED